MASLHWTITYVWPSANSPSSPLVFNSRLNLNPSPVLHSPMSLFSFISRHLPNAVLDFLHLHSLYHSTGKTFLSSCKAIYPWKNNTTYYIFLSFQRKNWAPNLSPIFVKIVTCLTNGHDSCVNIRYHSSTYMFTSIDY